MTDAENRRPTLLITAVKIQPYPRRYYSDGVLVVVCPFRQNCGDPTCGHKTTSYLARIRALDIARRKKAAEAIWFTPDNRLAEGCISNIFLVKKSVLYTPPIETPVLAGVARKTVCSLAVKNSIELVEKALYISDCLEAEEVFLTNVIMKIMPVSRIEKHAVGDGKVGPVTARLTGLFDKLVGSM